MSPSEITMLKFFLSEQYMEFVTSNQIFTIFFVFWGIWPRPHWGLCACMDSGGDGTHSFVPLRNKFLATPLSLSIYLPLNEKSRDLETDQRSLSR